jgi:hypothetical protein
MDNVLTEIDERRDSQKCLARERKLRTTHAHVVYAVKYRDDYVTNLQKSNHQEYRNRRKTSQVIIPETDHKDGSSIETENAPMTHPAVAFAFRDAQNSTLLEARQLMDKGFALKARITTDPYMKVIPKSEAPWRQEPAYAPLPAQVPPHTPAPAPSIRGSTRPNTGSYRLPTGR